MLEQVTEKEVELQLLLLVCYTGCRSGQAGEELHRARWVGGGGGLPRPLWEHHPS